MTHEVIVRPAATADLIEIYDWIADRSDPDTARAYNDRLLAACASLADYPRRGSLRDDLAPGLRTISFEGRAVIAYRITADAVDIVRILHHGRDLGRAFEGR